MIQEREKIWYECEKCGFIPKPLEYFDYCPKCSTIMTLKRIKYEIPTSEPTYITHQDYIDGLWESGIDPDWYK